MTTELALADASVLTVGLELSSTVTSCFSVTMRSTRFSVCSEERTLILAGSRRPKWGAEARSV
mgnify:CR=1 FL=1